MTHSYTVDLEQNFKQQFATLIQQHEQNQLQWQNQHRLNQKIFEDKIFGLEKHFRRRYYSAFSTQ